MIKKSGPWISFTEEALEKIKSAGYDDVEEKFQGEDNLLRYLENNPELTKYFFEDFKKTLENLFK